MSQNEMISKIEQLKEWEAILEEAQAEVERMETCITSPSIDTTVPSCSMTLF